MTQDHVWSPDDGYKIKNLMPASSGLKLQKLLWKKYFPRAVFLMIPLTASNVSELSKSSSRWDSTSHPIFSRQPRLNECLVQCQRLFVGVTFQCFHMLRSRMSDWAFLLIFHFIKQYSDIKLPWFSSQHRTESDFKQTSSSPYYRNEGKLLNVSMLTCWVRQNLPDDK